MWKGRDKPRHEVAVLPVRKLRAELADVLTAVEDNTFGCVLVKRHNDIIAAIVPLDPVKSILMNNHRDAYLEALETGLSSPASHRQAEAVPTEADE